MYLWVGLTDILISNKTRPTTCTHIFLIMVTTGSVSREKSKEQRETFVKPAWYLKRAERKKKEKHVWVCGG